MLIGINRTFIDELYDREKASEKLFSMRNLNSDIIEAHNNLLIARTVMSGGGDLLQFSLGGYGRCKYSGQYRVDDKTEGLLLEWLESARAKNEEAKAYINSVAERLKLKDELDAEIFLLNQPVSIIDIADKYGLSIEETVTRIKRAQRAADEIAYMDYTEESDNRAEHVQLSDRISTG